MTDLCTQAVQLAKLGYRVLPLAQDSRIPKGLKNWEHAATSEEPEVRKIWKRLPRANVGIATGYTFLVLDVDVKKGKHGLQSLSELRKKYSLPKTYTVKTPSGGLHLYYKHPYPAPSVQQARELGMVSNPHRAIKNQVNWKLDCFTHSQSGIDIRAEGGQVVAPGMRVKDFPGMQYEIVFDVPMADLPESLRDLLPYKDVVETIGGDPRETPIQTQAVACANGTVPTGTQAAGIRVGSEPAIHSQGSAVDSMAYRDLPEHIRAGDSNAANGLLASESTGSEYSKIPETIPAGGRDDTLFRFMCSWRERGYPLAHAEVLARELHSRLEQPAGDQITLTDVIAKLKRTYQTYQPSAIDHAAIQAVKPTQPLEALSAPGADPKAEVVLEPQRAIESVLEALNRFVFCVEGNSVIDTHKHPAYANIKMDAFKSAYGNVLLKTSNRANAKLIELPKLWIKHSNRQTVDDYGYLPNGPKVYEQLGTRFYNKWAPSELYLEMQNEADTPQTEHGRATDESNSDCSPFSNNDRVRRRTSGAIVPVRVDALKIFWRHLDYLFDTNEKEKQAFFNWFAYSVRYPERRIAHGVLLVSDPGVGKSWFFKLLQRLLGPYEVNTAGNAELESSFNEWVFGCSMVVIHELMTGNKKHMMQQLLSLITEERILINGKHKATRMRDIYANILAFSNHGANAAALMAKDRRFFVYQSAASKESASYYRELFGWLDTDGPLQLLKYVHQMDLSKFNPGEAPMLTAAKLRMEYANLGLVEQAIADAIEDRVGPFVSDIVSAEIVEKYLEAVMDLTAKDRQHARIAIAGYCPPLQQSRYRFRGDNKQYRLRAIRDGKRWSKAETDEVMTEFAKALKATMAPVKKLEVVQ